MYDGPLKKQSVTALNNQIDKVYVIFLKNVTR